MVLLIDDDLRSRRLLAQQFNHNLISASETSALSYAKQYQPEGIVADAASVSEVTRLVSSLRAIAPVSPVIIMSAHSSTVEGVRVMDAGAAAYLDKSAIAKVSGLLSRICNCLRPGKLVPGNSLSSKSSLKRQLTCVPLSQARDFDDLGFAG